MDDRDLDRYEQCQSPSHRRSRTDTGKFPRCWRAALLCLSGFLAAIGAAAPAAAAINYVQGNDNVADPGTSRSVTFTGAQSAGNLNVIIVSWFNATTTVTSIADTQGNAYTLAVGPTLAPGQGTQSLYYAKNIVAANAGANTVTVVLSSSAPLVDVRIAEYGGVDTSSPLDGVSGATGTGTTLNSGSVSTTSATDLLVAGDNMETQTTAADATFTQRLLTDWYDILEDRIVTSLGSYSAGATQSDAGWWIMQLAAFKAATTNGDSQAPTTPANLSATAASGSQINLSWTAATDNVAVTGYLIERCQQSGCTGFIPIGTTAGAAYTDTALSPATSYRYRLRARDAANNLSAYSTTSTATTQTAATSSIAYVQGNSDIPSGTSTIQVTYAAAQTAGNMNVVVVGWYNNRERECGHRQPRQCLPPRHRPDENVRHRCGERVAVDLLCKQYCRRRGGDEYRHRDVDDEREWHRCPHCRIQRARPN